MLETCHLYVECTYMTQMILTMTQIQTHQHRINLCCQGKDGWERDGLGVWDWQMQTITCGMDKQHATVSHRDSNIYYTVINYNRK